MSNSPNLFVEQTLPHSLFTEYNSGAFHDLLMLRHCVNNRRAKSMQGVLIDFQSSLSVRLMEWVVDDVELHHDQAFLQRIPHPPGCLPAQF